MTNRGEVDHEELIKMARAGLMEDEVRTTCLGFGDHYNEDLLKDMAAHGTGISMMWMWRENYRLCLRRSWIVPCTLR